MWQASADTDNDYLLSYNFIPEALNILLTKIIHLQMSWEVAWKLVAIILEKDLTKAKASIGKYYKFDIGIKSNFPKLKALSKYKG